MFSEDGGWIAVDGFRQGFDDSRAECWIVRRDGLEIRRLALMSAPTGELWALTRVAP